MKHYLLVFDHSIGELKSATPFKNQTRALVAYSQAERENLKNRHIEIVLIGADSLDTIRVTHANYFDSTVTSPYLAGLVS